MDEDRGQMNDLIHRHYTRFLVYKLQLLPDGGGIRLGSGAEQFFHSFSAFIDLDVFLLQYWINNE